MSVQALVVRIHVKPLAGADNLQLGVCSGHQVVVDKSTHDGDLGIFFPADSQLSQRMCTENNLFREGKGPNKDPKKAGYLEESRRVRCIKLRGVASEGIFLPVSSVAWAGKPVPMPEGYAFNEINGELICSKYMTAATVKAQRQNQQKAPKVNKCPTFYEHFDTQQLRYFVGSIPVLATLIFTEKLHGTSGRTGHHLVRLPLTKLQAKWNRFMSWTGYVFEHKWEYQVISGTRHTVLVPGKDDGYHRSNFRTDIHNTLAPRKGETIYYEIVGYEGTEKPIMSRQSLQGDDPVRKALRKHYGQEMTYSYGTEPTQYKIYVYRITHTDVDGKEHELSWHQIVRRAKELGLETVPYLSTEIYDSGKPDNIIEYSKKLAAGPSALDTRHIREGVCVRVEHEDSFGKVFKYKSFEFSYLEGILKDATDYVDPEEIA